jgi:hypothetical protein
MLRSFAVEPWGHVALSRISGTSTDDAPFESLHVTLVTWDSSGRLTCLGIYELEDAADAVARLHELAP